MTMYRGFIAIACICIAIACGTAACTAEVEERTENIVQAEREKTRRAGCPLDAIEYDVPPFMYDCVSCMKVTDRLSGESWWVLDTAKCGRVVLPIGGRNEKGND
jgi:hypothetical protein